MQKRQERKEQAAKWLGAGKTPVVVVGAVKGFVQSWGLPERSEGLDGSFRQPGPPPSPRQRKKPGSELPLPRPPASRAGQREAGRTGRRPAPRACPSCVVRLLGLSWR